MKWQRAARLVIALMAAAFAVAVVLNLRGRPQQTVEPPVARTDPKAVIESAGGQSFRVNREEEQVRVRYDKLLTYSDGASRMIGVTVTTNRSGRLFTISALEGQIGKAESVVELEGDVKVQTSDGLVMTTARATYQDADGLTRAPGFAEFSRGRMNGSGLGFTYDMNQDILFGMDQVKVHVAEDAAGHGALDIAAGAFEFRRDDRIIRFERSVRATRPRDTMEADSAVAHLSADEQQVESVELRGRSRVLVAKAVAGEFERLTGREVDLTYGQDGQSIERTAIRGTAVVRMASDAGRPGRQITADVIEFSATPGGVTLESLIARQDVLLSLPGGANGVSRTITSQTLDATGEAPLGLNKARFSGGVQFSERGSGVDRVARSAELEVNITPGFGAITDARFSRGVRFTDGPLSATATLARYDPEGGTLMLSGSDAGGPRPHLVNDQVTIDADTIDVTLEGPLLNATGSVKSTLQGERASVAGTSGPTASMKLPSMLKRDQTVSVTADALEYVGNPSRATYSGNALLWQGDTQIRAPSLVVDGTLGNLSATGGPVETHAMLQRNGPNGEKERVRTIGTANAFAYEDASRRATYKGNARLRGPQGDLTASTIELLLKPSGSEIDRVEGHDSVEVRVDERKVSGSRLTYFGDEERYVVTGTPMRATDQCGRETTGRTLTFFKSADRIVADGNDQVRTQTKGKSSCPGT